MGAKTHISKSLTSALLVFAVVGGTFASADAEAHGRGRVGVFFGFPGPIFYPAPAYYYPYPRYYDSPTAVVPPPSAPEYIEQNPPAVSTPPAPSGPSAPSAPSAPSGPSASSRGAPYYWYYCPDSKTYYPYVQTCPSQWQQVVPQSAPPS